MKAAINARFSLVAVACAKYKTYPPPQRFEILMDLLVGKSSSIMLVTMWAIYHSHIK